MRETVTTATIASFEGSLQPSGRTLFMELAFSSGPREHAVDARLRRHSDKCQTGGSGRRGSRPRSAAEGRAALRRANASAQ